MEIQQAIQDIRALIGASETAAAFQKTRQLFQEKQLEEPLVHLDMIEAEWNDIREQQINGLLAIDDQIRLQNINRAKLLQLLLDVGGQGDVDANLTPKPAAETTRKEGINQAFRTGFKNMVGVGLFIPTLGALIQRDWALAACFGLAGLITFVPTLHLIQKTIRYELLSWQKYVLVIGALLAVGSLYKP